MVLELGKLQKFSCLFSDNLVRQGNLHPDNPNHFWNALFLPFKEYRTLSSNEQIEYIQTQKLKLSSIMTKQSWITYIENFHSQSQILHEFTKQFINDTHDINPILKKLLPDRESLMDDILSQLSEYDVLSDTILSLLSQSFDKQLSTLEQKENKKISQDKKNKCSSIFSNYIHELWSKSEEDAFQIFLTDFCDPNKNIDIYIIPYILSLLDFKVFFIDFKTRDLLLWNQMYETHMKIINNDQHYILLLCQDNIIFESLGVIYPDDDKNVNICRLFMVNDDIITSCYDRF